MQGITREQFLNYKLTGKEQVSYGLAYFGGNLLANMVASFVTYYYTNSVGVTAAAVGTMILLSKFLDGISDFIMALIIEKTNTKWGKAVPWFIIATIPMALSMVLLFTCPSGLSETGKIVWMYATYIFCNCIAYTAVVLALATMIVYMTGNPAERTKASAWGIALGSVALIIVSMFTESIASMKGWMYVSIVYAVMALVCLVFAALFCRERQHLIVDQEGETAEKSAEDNMKMSEGLKILVKNKYFWSLFAMTAFRFVPTGAAMGVAVYFFINVYNNSSLFGVVSMMWFLPAIILSFTMTPLVKKFGYRWVFAIGFFFQAAGYFVGGYTNNFAILSVAAILVGIGATNNTLFFPFIGYVVDYGELKYGVSLSGLTSSGYSIGIKIGTGIGGALVGWILALSGYDAAAAVQSASALGGIRFIFGGIPAIASLLAGLICLTMKMEKENEEMRAKQKSM